MLDRSSYARIATLEEENRQLRIKLLEATRPKMSFPAAWGLSINESRILAAIIAGNGRFVSTERLFNALYGWGDPAVTIKNIHVFINRLRRKLPQEIVVISVRIAGYAVSVDGLKIIREATR